MADSIIAVAAIIHANSFPFNSSTIFQAKTMVRAPNKAGKNFTQNSPPPSWKIIQENHDVNGGTETNPQATCLPWSR
jgi:hypothetical protein